MLQWLQPITTPFTFPESITIFQCSVQLARDVDKVLPWLETVQLVSTWWRRGECIQWRPVWIDVRGSGRQVMVRICGSWFKIGVTLDLLGCTKLPLTSNIITTMTWRTKQIMIIWTGHTVRGALTRVVSCPLLALSWWWDHPPLNFWNMVGEHTSPLPVVVRWEFAHHRDFPIGEVTAGNVQALGCPFAPNFLLPVDNLPRECLLLVRRAEHAPSKLCIHRRIGGGSSSNSATYHATLLDVLNMDAGPQNKLRTWSGSREPVNYPFELHSRIFLLLPLLIRSPPLFPHNVPLLLRLRLLLITADFPGSTGVHLVHWKTIKKYFILNICHTNHIFNFHEHATKISGTVYTLRTCSYYSQFLKLAHSKSFPPLKNPPLVSTV